MHASSILAVLAAGAAVVSGTTLDGTTTSTSTMTKTLTITKCNPTATGCPLHQNSTTTTSSTSSIKFFPMSNSTSTVGPTVGSTGVLSQTSLPGLTVTNTAVVGASTTGPAAPSTTSPKSGAAGLLIQSGLLMGAVGAAIAFLA